MRNRGLLANRSRIVAVVLVVLLILTGIAALLTILAEPATPGAASQQFRTEHPGLTRLLAAARGAGDRVEAPATIEAPRFQGVATLNGPPSANRVRALERSGLEVRPLGHLPLAFVAGTTAQLLDAVTGRAARDIWPNERLGYFSSESNAAMGIDTLRAEGLTGKGVGVAIVDNGVDATHPDLADHVTHNFKIVSGDYLGDPVGDLIPPVVIPFDGLPYGNTDLTTGHGTHVAGIVAADGHTSPDQVGVAPDATIVSYAVGDAIFLFSQLAAFDSILAHHEEWNIRVVNNSWGAGFGLFDPSNPINVATKAMHDAGILVIFAAGNAGEQMTLNPFSAAPWVLSVGATTLDGKRAAFSSAGLQYDNSSVVEIPADDHVRFEGDGLGIYHPDVAAPGQAIVSSGTPTGIATLSPAAPGGTATLSGTSMAAPHVAGLAALLLEARPELTPDELIGLLQVTAAPVTTEEGGRVPFWESGYGSVNPAAALALIRRPDFSPALLTSMQSEADARALAERPYRVITTDFWRYQAPPVSVNDVRAFYVDIPQDTVAVQFSIAYPSLPALGLNLFDYALTLKDGNGRTVARSVSSLTNGLSDAFVSLVPAVAAGEAAPRPSDIYAFGAQWKLEVKGIALADPELPLPGLMGNGVTVAVSTLAAEPGTPPPAEAPPRPPPQD
ncbi:MAG: S8 family peptidase, partial [Actinomycetota bacterium]